MISSSYFNLGCSSSWLMIRVLKLIGLYDGLLGGGGGGVWIMTKN